MGDILHSWVTSVICTAMFCAVVISITPKGRVYSAIKIICGVVMVFSIISPIAQLNPDVYSSNLAKYKSQAEQLVNGADKYEDNLNRSFIEDKCAAYILDKAENFGAELNYVTVSAKWSMGGYWYPESADIGYSCSDELKSRLSSALEAELGIAKERQVWTLG